MKAGNKNSNVLKTLGIPRSSEAGQALITLLFFMVIGITIITATISILYINIQGTTTIQNAEMAYYYAETGIEDSMLKLLRNPSYTGTYSALPAGSGQATVVITSTLIKSTGVSGNTTRVISVQPTYANGILSYSNWKEINQ